jgi:uncharacterized protein YndB with AHSA1/START domain
MAPLVHTIEIARSPEEVYAYATDPSRFTQWQGDVVSVRIEGGGPLRAGSRIVTTRRIGGTNRTMVQEVTDVEPPHRWAARGVDGPIRPNASVTVEPKADGAGSLVTFTLDFKGHGIGVPLVPAVRRMAAKGAPISHQNLKRLLEHDG